MNIPRAFISYSHDSQAHKKWVLDLATRLRNTGIDAILDQWDLKPGDDLPLFMEKNLASADRVLMVCTDRYVEKANAGSGGVGYEKMIATANLLKSIDSNKVVPIIRQAGTYAVPTFLKTKLFIDFSQDDQHEFAFDELARTIHGAPLFVKPPVGNNPFAQAAASQERTGDPLLKLMTLLIAMFEELEARNRYLLYEHAFNRWGSSRTMFDVAIAQASAEGLVYQFSPIASSVFLELTAKGKMYAIQHKLVKQ